MAKIMLNVNEDVYNQILKGRKTSVDVSKGKFKNKVDTYDEIEIIKWGAENQSVTVKITQIIVNPETQTYTVDFRKKESVTQKIIRETCWLFSLGIILGTGLFYCGYKHRQVNRLEQEVYDLMLENVQLQRRVRVCLYED